MPYAARMDPAEPAARELADILLPCFFGTCEHPDAENGATCETFMRERITDALLTRERAARREERERCAKIAERGIEHPATNLAAGSNMRAYEIARNIRRDPAGDAQEMICGRCYLPKSQATGLCYHNKPHFWTAGDAGQEGEA